MKTCLILSALTAFYEGGRAASRAGNITSFTDPATGREIRHFDCNVDRSKASVQFNATLAKLHNRHGKSKVGVRAVQHFVRQSFPVAIRIPLYIHVLTKESNADTITQDMVTRQAEVLNWAYNSYGILFDLQGSTFHANDAWAVADGVDMDSMKQTLRLGSYSVLNIYFHTDLNSGILGTCTLPSQVTANMPRSAYFSDGCNIDAATMPGGGLEGYNQGKTAVHETGHWLGLLHTFEGYSCDGDGDSIGDTPMQSVSTNGCPVEPAKDSCAGVAGVDSIHNYMDYSTDSCYTSFTPLQALRMSDMWTQFRRDF